MNAGNKLRMAELLAVFLLAGCLTRMPANAKIKLKEIAHLDISENVNKNININKNTNNDTSTSKDINTNNLKDAYLIKSENNDLAIVSTKAEAQKALEAAKQYFINKYKLIKDKDYNIGFSEKIDIVKTKAEQNKIISSESAENVLQSKGNCNYKYKILNGENLWNICNREHIDIEKVLKMNPKAEKNTKPGDFVILYKYAYKLGLKWNEKNERDEKIAYSVESQKTNKLLQGKIKVQTEGQYGLRHIVEEITKVDGVDVNKQVTENKVVKNPVSEKQLLGTSLTMPTFALGMFSRPVLGKLSSKFGPRWGKFHYGVDLAADIGTNIRAVDGGIVICAGWVKGYGNFIEIDHENSYISGYGHCSKLFVKEGQRVYAGEKIGEVGNTGRSTGPHLHFEIRKNGTPINPWPFISKYY